MRKRTRAALLRLDGFIASRSQNAILLLCLVLALLIGALDYRGSTGLLIVYLVPISVAAWYGGARVGAVISIYCSAAWFLASNYATHFEGFDPFSLLSLLARLTIFLVLTQVIARLRESMRQQRELMQFIVHDLRSPISSSITGLLTLQETADGLNELDREMVSLALVSNQRALTLVNSMLDVAKLETGKMSIRLETTELGPMVDRCFEQVQLWAMGEEVRLVPAIEVPIACLDEDLVSRVLVNLLSNALKYSPRGRAITVTATAMGHGGVRFEVVDQGPGIPPEYIQSIFEPFGQVKGTTGGTGLGLTFCRLAVQAQGGKIWAESSLGKGTSMIFTLPHHLPADSVITSEGDS